MHATYQTTGIILKKSDFKENDFLVTLLSREHGKLKLRLKSGKKSYSKLQSHCEPFSETELLVAHSKTIDIACNAISLNQFTNIRQDYAKTTTAFYFCQLTEKLLRENLPSLSIYKLLKSSLEKLNSETVDQEVELLSRYFEYRLLSLLGWKPALSFCPKCQKNHSKNAELFFSAENGGVICKTCKLTDFSAKKILPSSHKVLLQFETKNINLYDITIREINEVKKINNFFLSNYLPKIIPSKKILEEQLLSGF